VDEERTDENLTNEEIDEEIVEVAESRSWTNLDTMAITWIGVVAAVIRLIGLDIPKQLIFDEVYYAKDACWYVTSSATLCDVTTETTQVHPPLGKWLIALGIRLGGYDSFGWRIACAVAGVITIVLLYILARRLLHSTLGAAMAAGLLAIDPLHFVQSRTSMLDIFVPMFGLAAVLFAVYDRDQVAQGPRPRGLMQRPWRLAAGAACGAAIASKWSGLFYLLLIILLTIAWEISARRKDGEGNVVLRFLREEAASIVLWLVLVPIVVYVFTYIGRLDGSFTELPWAQGSWGRAFWDRQKYMLDFHRELTSTHGYQSPAWSWIALKRPVSYYFETDTNGDYKEIMATGNPFVWWLSVVALIYCAFRWIRQRSLTSPEGVILGGFVFTYIPWVALGTFSNRSAVFLFYLLPVLPFMCLALAYVATSLGNSWEAKAAISVFSLTAVSLFVFYYPVLTGRPLSVGEWDKRIWIFDHCEAAEKTPTESTITSVVDGKTEITTTDGTSEDSLPPKGWCWI
jgi:dolichyl-phosphate-mannose--protein O-mannosyl transferase